MNTDYIQQTVDKARTNESRCRTMGWRGHAGIGCYLTGTRTATDVLAWPISRDIPADADGVIVIEWYGPAGHDDDPMSSGGGVYLTPCEDRVIHSAVFPLSPAGIDAARRKAAELRLQ